MKMYKKIAMMLMVATTVFAADSDRYSVLEKNFNEANLILTKEELQGGYLGRCFKKGNNTPRGMICSTKKFTKTIDNHGGPLFPDQVENTWKMAYYLKHYQWSPSYPPLEESAESNDNTTKAEDDDFWNSHDGRDGNGMLSEDNGTIIGDYGWANIEMKKSADGYFYGRIVRKNDAFVSYYCYFYKKLF